MKWRQVKLGEVCEFKYGKSLVKETRVEDGPYPVYGSSGIVGHHNEYVVDGPCLVVGRKGSIGSVFFSEQPCYPIDTAYFVHCKEEMNLRFLYYQLSTLRLNELNKAAAIPGLNREDAYRKLITLPPLDVQQRIADTLDTADALRRKDQELLRKYDELAQSIFYEMFGDPSRNERGWKLTTIRELVREVKYGTSSPASNKGEYPYLRMNNLTYRGELDLRDLKRIDVSEADYKKYGVQQGDLLFNRTNSKELVGKTTVVDIATPMVAAGYLIRVRCNELANPYFISAYLNSEVGKSILRNMCKSIVGMANINAQELQDIPIIAPPKDLQDVFVERLLAVKRLKALAVKDGEYSEALFGSQLHRFF